jgi:hypothetical protein
LLAEPPRQRAANGATCAGNPSCVSHADLQDTFGFQIILSGILIYCMVFVERAMPGE